MPDIVHVDEKSAVVSCKLYEDKADAADQFLAQASAQRFCSEEKYGDRYLEIAETAAIGRVLAAAGYGTQFCGNIPKRWSSNYKGIDDLLLSFIERRRITDSIFGRL